MNNSATQSISIIDLPITGGWQSWQTTTREVILDAGVYSLKMKVLRDGFNMNWFEFVFVSSLGVENAKSNTLVSLSKSDLRRIPNKLKQPTKSYEPKNYRCEWAHRKKHNT